MLSPRWRKVLRDLLGNKTRTILVVLSIAVGVFAVGMIGGSREVIDRDMSGAWTAANPAAATIYTDGFDDDLVATVRHMKGVGDAQGRREVGVRVQVAPDQWRNLQLVAIPDDGVVRINEIKPLSGGWPPAPREMLVERESLRWLGLSVGDKVVVETGDGKRRELRIAGLAYDYAGRAPAMFAGSAGGYVNFDTMEWLGQPRDYNQLLITVAEDKLNKAHVEAIAAQVRAKVEKSGREVYYTYVGEPGKHPIDGAMQVFMSLLSVLGFLSLVLSGFLVVNTISALLTQQTRQIGVMKAVGARRGQIAAMYLVMVLAFGLLALAVGIPLGMLGAYGLGGFIASMMNFDATTFVTPPHVLAIQVAVGLAVPLLAALWPVLNGTRISVREALSAEGASRGQLGNSLVDRLIGRVRGLSRPLLLSLRNTFRRKGRLALTLSTLTLGGAIFIAVMCVRASTFVTTDEALQYFNYDFGVSMAHSFRRDALVQEALAVPGVVKAESLRGSTVRRLRPDGTEGPNFTVLALPADTTLIKPSLLSGRWLVPEDEDAIVLNTFVLKDEKDVQVGDRVTLKLDGRDTTWQVVGTVKGVMTGPIGYANQPYFERVAGGVGRGGSLWVVTDKHDAAYQAEVAKALEAHFKSVGMRVSQTETMGYIRTMIATQFEIIIVFLMVMAVLLAVVGGLGLMGTMSLNVLERTREIGVLRAVGASDGAVRRIFIVEGVLIGVLSWAVGMIVALPLSKLMSDSVGQAFLQAPMTWAFSPGGALIWLGIVVVLATLASLLPARSASKLSVREVLAYE